MLEDEREIPVARVERLEQKMLDLHVVVRAREAQPRGGLECVPRGGVQLADQASKIDGHGVLALKASESYRPRPPRTAWSPTTCASPAAAPPPPPPPRGGPRAPPPGRGRAGGRTPTGPGGATPRPRAEVPS